MNNGIILRGKVAVSKVIANVSVYPKRYIQFKLLNVKMLSLNSYVYFAVTLGISFTNDVYKKKYAANSGNRFCNTL